MYNNVGNILKELDGNNKTNSLSSIKNVIYRHTNSKDPKFKSIYKLSMEIIKNKQIIHEIIKNYFNDDTINNINLLKILIYEMCIKNRKCKMGGKIAKIVKDKKDLVKKYISKHYNKQNTNIDTIMYFRSVNKEDLSLSLLAINGVLQDTFIKGLYLIDKEKHQESLNEIFSLKEENKIVIQSKASCLPPYLLYLYLTSNPNEMRKQYTIIDSCSAPGNKTLQLGEYFPSNNIIAYELNKKRYELLNDNINRLNYNNNIITINSDFLLTDPNDNQFKNVEVFLVDPSCSGSGTLNNSIMNNYSGCVCDIANSEIELKEKNRLNSLASFQLKILIHCLKFPNVKVISYSTCSVFSTEDEFVIDSLLKEYPKKIRIIDINELIPEKNLNYHQGLIDSCKGALRMCRKCHDTDGFFVALIKVIQ